MVGVKGLKPSTSRSQTARAINCATPRFALSLYSRPRDFSSPSHYNVFMVSKKISRKLAFVNIFGTLGYFSLIIQWLWTGLILIYPVILSGNADYWLCSLQPKPSEKVPVAAADFGAATPFFNVLALVITALILVTAVVILFRLPKKIGKTGARLTQSAANVVIPAIAHTDNVPKSTRKRLSFQLVVAIKCLLTITALALLLFAQPVANLSFSIIWAIGSFCFICTMIYWLIQYVSARVGRVPREKIW